MAEERGVKPLRPVEGHTVFKTGAIVIYWLALPKRLVREKVEIGLLYRRVTTTLSRTIARLRESNPKHLFLRSIPSLHFSPRVREHGMCDFDILTEPVLPEPPNRIELFPRPYHGRVLPLAPWRQVGVPHQVLNTCFITGRHTRAPKKNRTSASTVRKSRASTALRGRGQRQDLNLRCGIRSYKDRAFGLYATLAG